jgi:hypothetical protein
MQRGLHRFFSFGGSRRLCSVRRVSWFLVLSFAAFSSWNLIAQTGGEEIEDITGNYEFLGPHDALAVLEDGGKLNGYIDVFQDDVLSYGITLGWRKDRRVEIKTAAIHRKYYRFKGTVERGRGRGENDPDYLRLVGDVEIITMKGDSGEESIQKTQVVLKSLGWSEEE